MSAISKERAKQSRALGAMPLLAIYKNDGPVTLALIDEIRAWMSCKPEDVEIEDWEREVADKLPRWRAKLRTARYLDWRAKREQ